jgi:hypothetical protein
MFLRNGTILFRRDVQDYADQKSIEELTIDIFDMSYEHESPYTSFTLYEDDGWSQDYHSGEQRIVGYNWGTSGACAILSRNEFKSGYKGPDRKLTLRFHNSNQTSVQYYLNDIPIRSTDARLKYDADKNILEVRLASEFNFKTFMIAARSPQEPERP